ncbi:MAG: hypothetical protein C0490_10500 [Marivirga sp.]|nr:hypothetical protein [Marivirga sp.]
MKYFDFSVQTILISLTIIVLITSQSGLVPAILTMQILVGSWQILSALFLVISMARFQRLRMIHLLTSVIYLAILPGIMMTNLSPGLMTFLFMVPAWCLAMFYYIITAITLFKRPYGKGSFLPHLSF